MVSSLQDQQGGQPEPTRDTAAKTEHLYILDVMRTVAALRIAICHWDNFNEGLFADNQKIASVPAAISHFVYHYIGFGVDFFFTLSGFIFILLYASKIRTGKVSAAQFAQLRLSRLYPLHLLTLVAVLALQWIYKDLAGAYFRYPISAAEFAQHLVLASDWGRGWELSFNGPAWSLSAEVFVYFIFFAICSRGFTKWWNLALLAILGVIAWRMGFIAIGRAMTSFFAGGVACVGYLALKKKELGGRKLNFSLVVCASAWAVVLFAESRGFFHSEYRQVFGRSLEIGGRDVIGAALLSSGMYVRLLLLLPLTVLVLTMNDARWRPVTRKLSLIVNWSYPIYLLHFPLQIVFAIAVMLLGLHYSVLVSPVTFCLYFAILLPLAHFSYKKVQVPAQHWIRDRWGGARKPRPVQGSPAPAT